MEYSDLTAREEILLLMIRRAEEKDPTSYLVSIAMLLTAANENYLDLLDGYTRGDFKRAIKFLRRLQKEFPQYAAAYGEAAQLIRREWLHRAPKEDAASEAGDAPASQGRVEYGVS